MKREIVVWDHAGEILKAVQNGALITAKAGDRVNPMTIGWGALCVEWNTPIFIAYVREGRFTRELLDQSMSFTVNIPVGECDGQIIRVCGTKSGRDIDKVAALGLHLEPSEKVAAPGIRELPLTLECRVVYRKLQDRSALDASKQRFYPQDTGSEAPGSNRDYHVAYYGEILKAYIIE